LSTSTFSPDGRVFQVEYAAKAVDNSGTAVGVVCKDGLVLAVEKAVLSKMMVPGSARRVYAVDKHLTLVISGFVTDGRQLVAHAREEAISYKKVYGEPIPPFVLAERIGLFVHAYTLYWTVRPFGASILLGGYDKANGGEPELYCIEPSGTCYKYFGMAIGKGKQSAKTEIEKLKLQETTCEEAMFSVVKILRQIQEDAKDRQVEIEISWICPSSNYEHQIVPPERVKEVQESVVKSLEEMDQA